jgi:F-type H+-transporting ATPase subunit epsilon
MSLHFELVTPERTVFKKAIDQVTLPTSMGEITILANHLPLVASLVPGVARLKTGSEEEEVAVSGGFIEVGKDSVRVLADTAERGEELDLSVIEEAKKRAEQVMKETVKSDDVSFAAAAAALERELARFRVARKHAGRRRGVTPTMNDASIPMDQNES